MYKNIGTFRNMLIQIHQTLKINFPPNIEHTKYKPSIIHNIYISYTYHTYHVFTVHVYVNIVIYSIYIWHRCLYVSLAITVCLLTAGLLIFFMFPRDVKISNDVKLLLPKNLTIDLKREAVNFIVEVSSSVWQQLKNFIIILNTFF